MFQMTEEFRSLLQEPWAFPQRYPQSSSTGQRAAISGSPPTLASSTLATSRLASAKFLDSRLHLVWPLVRRRLLAATPWYLPQRFIAEQLGTSALMMRVSTVGLFYLFSGIP